MSEDKFTPGPWVRRGREIAKYGDDWACIAVLCNPRQTDDPNPAMPPELLSMYNPRFAEGIANGDLMKAAPVMLAALEATREFLCEAEIDSGQEAELLRCMGNLDAAIKAARGEG